MSFWQDLLSGAGAGFGAYDLYNRLDKEKGQIGNQIGKIQRDALKQGKFQPWTITGGAGTVSGGPDGMDMTLSDPMQQYQDQMMGRGDSLLGQSMQDTMGREQDLYARMREIQAPGERQGLQNMNQRMLSQGRSGMGSTEFGGSPEQMAYYKAMGQAQNEAAMGAREQAMAEQMQQYNMGMGMSQESFNPMNQLFKQAGLGQNNAQMGLNAGQNNAALIAQLGLGGMTARQNYGNLQTKMLGDLYGMGSGILGGVGANIDKSGGNLWNFLKSLKR